MELALSLGDTPNLPFSFLDKPNKDPLPSFFSTQQGKTSEEKRGSSDPPIQLDLLPFTPVLRSPHPPIPWLTQPCNFLFTIYLFLSFKWSSIFIPYYYYYYKIHYFSSSISR